MSNLLEQAHSAARQENWQVVNQCLQQLASQPSELASEPATDCQSGQADKISWVSVLSLALGVLEAGDFQERWEVAKMFPRLGADAIEPLVEILQDEEANLELRWFAARILGQFDRPEVVEALIELLHDDEDEELSSMAASALASLGDSAIAALTDLLTAKESRLLAVRSLAKIRNRHAIEPLIGVMGDSDAAVRSAAIEALISFDDARIVPVLVEALNDIAATVRREATIGLGLCAMRKSRETAIAEFDLTTLLRDRLWDFNIEVCQQAAIALGRLGTARAAAALSEVLESPATPVPLQSEVVRALAWMETPEALEYLSQAFIDRQAETSYPEVFQEIAKVLGGVEKPEFKSKAAQVLMDVLQTEPTSAPIENSRIKQAIALGLGRLGQKQALNCLIQLLADPDAGVRLHAISALKQLAPQEAHQQLQQLAADKRLPVELQKGVAIALQEWSLNG